MEERRRTVRVTRHQFEQLRYGMSYADAVRVLGSPGREESRSYLANTSTVEYVWPGNGDLSASASAMFQSDLLVLKEQFGLK